MNTAYALISLGHLKEIRDAKIRLMKKRNRIYNDMAILEKNY